MPIKNSRALAACIAIATGAIYCAQDAGFAVPERPCIIPSCESSPPSCRKTCKTSTLWGRIKAHQQRKWWGYPEEFCEPPLGTFVDAASSTQIANGQAALLVLYQYDFVAGSAKLNSRGKEQLEKIAALLPRSFAPVVIEKSKETWHLDEMVRRDLDEVRRQTVLEELARYPFPVPNERVVVGNPLAHGLDGSEALRLLDKARQGSHNGAFTNNGMSGQGAGGSSGQPVNASAGGSPY